MEGGDLKKQRRVAVQRLTGSVQNYDWGRTGRDSLVAMLYELNSGAGIDPDGSYAEFWMGTHGSGPSFLVKNGVQNGVSNGGGDDGSFKSWILKNPSVLGDKVLDKWGCDLPFLFKLLHNIERKEIIMEIDGFAKLKKLQKFRCSIQNYDWGRLGYESLVARLFRLNSGSKIELERPYTEFWMGTRDCGPSVVVQNVGENCEQPVGLESESLKLWVSKNLNVLGKNVLGKWDRDLPFLFKVLSVAKALSIQAHPDKDLAKTLHKLLPNVYKDDNHKPEMALAITKFEALCGFISLQELKIVLQDVPEVVELVGIADANQVLHINEEDGEEKVKSVLRSIFTQLMRASKEMTTKAVSKLKSRLHMESQVRPLTEKEQLVLRLEKQYPADIGVVSAFFFNYVKLNPGEALYLGANEPHAYIYGECVECMATSDNVVRAGLTPKHRDIETLCSMLTYKQGFPEILKGFPLSPYITRYLPPFDEFEVDSCLLPQGATTVFPAISGPSVFLVTVGEGTMGAGSFNDAITEGDVLFAPANTEISITASSEVQLYRAGVNSRFLQAL